MHATSFTNTYMVKKLTIETNHKPLETIFKKPICNAPPRLQRILLDVASYSPTVIYKKGESMYLADILSRDCENPAATNEEDVEVLSILSISDTAIERKNAVHAKRRSPTRAQESHRNRLAAKSKGITCNITAILELQRRNKQLQQFTLQRPKSDNSSWPEARNTKTNTLWTFRRTTYFISRSRAHILDRHDSRHHQLHRTMQYLSTNPKKQHSRTVDHQKSAEITI